MVERTLDASKVAFVVRGGARAEEQQRYLACLRVPDGMTAEVVTVDGTDAEVATLYNEAQAASDARYKVYLAPDAVILHETFLADVLAVFRAAPDVGIIGVLGARQLRTDGVFDHALGLVGRAVVHEEGTVRGKDIVEAYEVVQVLGGGVIATQVDVPWPEGQFEGTSCLAMATSIEYRRAGYRAAVPQQADDWMICGALHPVTDVDERDRQAFLDAYSRDLYPLVSVVIPTYQRPAYFREALASVVHQTYRNLDIFVTDNSHNDETRRVYETEFADDPRITYEHHPDFDADGNWGRALAYDNPAATYVNWLMDDDYFLPEKIARMMDCYFEASGITLVTSVRKWIDGDGNDLPKADWMRPLVSKLSRLDGRSVGQDMLRNMTNYIGEPTTVLIKKSAMNHHRLGWSGKEGKYLISDFPTWLCLLSKGDCVYFPEPLSTFRFHEGQQQEGLFSKFASHICWALQIREAIQRNIFLTSREDRQKAMLCWLERTSGWLRKLPEEALEHPAMADVCTIFRSMVAALPEADTLDFTVNTEWEKV